jgi:lipopolysaccharide/colanic/teichoic acid biosynthesis glycosyltransferase
MPPLRGSTVSATPFLTPAVIHDDRLGTTLADLADWPVGNVRLATDPWARIAKRVIDIVLSSVALLVLCPVFALIALAVRIDSRGPVLFRQERIGKYGRSFVMLKFRTMTADRRTRNIGPPEGMSERRRVHKSPNDPRITFLGRFLRRTCLDELPQFWNVLCGSMSLVGPRPELPDIVAQYEPWQHARHLTPPGITGWWQVNRDGVHLMHQATELDIFYLEHWSVSLDFRILASTLGIVLRGVGAF